MAFERISFKELKPAFKSRTEGIARSLAGDPASRAALTLLAGLLMVLLLRWGMTGKLLPHLALWLLPVPGLFYVFLSKTGSGNTRLYIGKWSRRAAVIAAGGFLLSPFVGDFAEIAALATGMVGSMFIFIDYHEFRRLVRRNAYSAVIATAGALSGIGFMLSQMFAWKWTAGATVRVVFLFLDSFIRNLTILHRPRPPVETSPHYHGGGGVHRIYVRVPVRSAPPPHPRWQGRMHHALPTDDAGAAHADHAHMHGYLALASDHFILRMFPVENVALGIFMFLLLLSVDIVATGRHIKPMQLAIMVGGGIALMFCINAMVMAVYFCIADLALTPGAASVTIAIARVLHFLISQPVIAIAAYVVLSMALVRGSLLESLSLKYKKA